jgi:hypothetical protein
LQIFLAYFVQFCASWSIFLIKKIELRSPSWRNTDVTGISRFCFFFFFFSYSSREIAERSSGSRLLTWKLLTRFEYTSSVLKRIFPVKIFSWRGRNEVLVAGLTKKMRCFVSRKKEARRKPRRELVHCTQNSVSLESLSLELEPPVLFFGNLCYSQSGDHPQEI